MEQLRGDKDELLAAGAILSGASYLISPLLYQMIRPFVLHNLDALGLVFKMIPIKETIIIGGSIVINPKIVAGVLLIGGAAYIVYKVSKNK